MLPSWRERLIIDVSPHRVAVTRYARGWRKRLLDHRQFPCGPATDAADWEPAVSALGTFLSAPGLAPANTVLVLSNHFVRYLLMPWNAQIARRSEELTVAGELLARQYGDAMLDWEVEVSGARVGSNRVAAAIDRRLLDAISSLFTGSAIRLQAVRPHFMHLVNEHRHTFSGDAWIVIKDSDRMLLGFLRDGDWLSLRSRPVTQAIAIEPVLEQEALLHGILPVNEKIYVYATDKPDEAVATPGGNATPLPMVPGT